VGNVNRNQGGLGAKFRVEMTCLLPADNCKTVFKKSLQREGLLRDKERNPSLQVVGTRSGAIRARTSNGDEKGKHPPDRARIRRARKRR
jgi:hypothetical protein